MSEVAILPINKWASGTVARLKRTSILAGTSGDNLAGDLFPTTSWLFTLTWIPEATWPLRYFTSGIGDSGTLIHIGFSQIGHEPMTIDT